MASPRYPAGQHAGSGLPMIWLNSEICAIGSISVKIAREHGRVRLNWPGDRDELRTQPGSRQEDQRSDLCRPQDRGHQAVCAATRTRFRKSKDFIEALNCGCVRGPPGVREPTARGVGGAGFGRRVDCRGGPAGAGDQFAVSLIDERSMVLCRPGDRAVQASPCPLICKRRGSRVTRPSRLMQATMLSPFGQQGVAAENFIAIDHAAPAASTTVGARAEARRRSWPESSICRSSPKRRASSLPVRSCDSYSHRPAAARSPPARSTSDSWHGGRGPDRRSSSVSNADFDFVLVDHRRPRIARKGPRTIHLSGMPSLTTA